MTGDCSIRINGTAEVLPRAMPLLSAIRDRLGLTGAKPGCGEGACGACTVLADGDSTKYKARLEDGTIQAGRPMFTYQPGFKGIDAVTSATAQYFTSRGLLYTYRGGRRVSAYHLQLAEWLDVIRNGGQTSCNIDRGFEEAITCHMATKSFLENRKVTWDPGQRRIV